MRHTYFKFLTFLAAVSAFCLSVGSALAQIDVPASAAESGPVGFAGSGLKGEYWHRPIASIFTDGTTVPAHRIDTQINTFGPADGTFRATKFVYLGNDLTPVLTWLTNDAASFVGTTNNLDDGAFRFRGYINRPTAGVLRLGTTSDDGARITIAGIDITNGDGSHGDETHDMDVNFLAAGLYPIEITYFAGDWTSDSLPAPAPPNHSGSLDPGLHGGDNFHLRIDGADITSAQVGLLHASAPSPLPSVLNIGTNKVGTVTDNGGGSFSVLAGGNDIWDQRDEFTYAYTEVSGDFDVQVRVESLQFTANWTKAGLMARESLSEYSRMAFLRVTPSNTVAGAANDVRFSYRTGLHNMAGINGGQHEDPAAPYPTPNFPNAWLRLVRAGGMIHASNSVDGVAWNFVASQDTTAWGGGALPKKLYVGLATSRHSGASLTAAAEYRNFKFNINAAPFAVVGADSRGNPTGVSVAFNRPLGAGGFDPISYTLTAASGPNVTVVAGLRFTTANDAPERDPLTFTLEGTTADPAVGDWQLIASGNTGLGTNPGRNTAGPIVPVANTGGYRAYRLLFPTVRDAAAANSMQVGEIEFLDAGGNDVTAPGDAVVGVLAVAGSSASAVAVAGTVAGANNYPAAESPNLATDNSAGTKYLNFAKVNTGIIVTPAGGAAPPSPTVTEVKQGPGLNTVQLTTTPLVEGATYNVEVAFNVQDSTGEELTGTDTSFVHGAGYEARPIRVSHSKTDDSGPYRYSDAVAKGIGDVVALGGGVFPGVEGNSVFEDPIPDLGTNEGFSSRISGVLNITTSGNYTFYMSSDDFGFLYLSTNDDPAKKVQIANEPAWNGRREYIAGGNQASRGVPPANISAPIALQAGGRYYLELIFTEGGGGNNGSATWVPPGGAAVTNGSSPIPESAFKPSRVANGETFIRLGPVQIVSQPQDALVAEGTNATFTVRADGTPAYTYQWRKNGANIPGANGRSYTTPPFVLSDEGAAFSVVVANEFSSATSANALLTGAGVDQTPPTLLRANGSGVPATSFDVVFSEAVNATDAQNLANYSVNGGVTLSSAVLQADNRTVHFVSSALNTTNILTVNNVRDRAGTPNTIVANSQVRIAYAEGRIRYFQFDDAGTSVNVADLFTNPKFPNFPDRAEYRTSMEAPDSDGGNNFQNYGGQLQGFLTAPVTGQYTFYMASDDQGVLYLSTDSDPAHKVEIAREPVWSVFRSYVGTGAGGLGRVCPGTNCNISAPITLQAGQKYYIEGLVKEAGGGDYISVAWQTPASGPQPNPVINGMAPIPGDFLSPYDQAATITPGTPADIAISAGLTATFTAGIQASAPLNVTWYRSGAEVPGETKASLSLTNVQVVDSGATFYVVVSNSLSVVTSRVATLTVATDLVPPRALTAGVGFSLSNIVVRFSERVDTTTAQDLFNYDAPGFVISGAVLDLGGSNVVLTVDSALEAGRNYSVSIQNIADVNGNVLDPNPTTLSFSVSSGGGYPATVMAANPIAYWRFNESPPTAINVGSLGAAANGTYNGGATTGSQAPRPPVLPGFETGNTALQLDGVDDFVGTLAGLMNDRPVFTVSGWIRRNADQGSRIGLFGQNDLIELGYIDNNTIQLWTDNGLNVTPNPFPNEEWAHLAIVSDGSPGTASIYTNGVLAGSRPHTLPANNTFPWNIGGGGVFDAIAANGNYFNGQIDEVAIFATAFGPAQIQAQYRSALEEPGYSFSDCTLPAGTIATPTTAGGPYVGDDLTGNCVLHLTDRVNSLANYWAVPFSTSQKFETINARWRTKIEGVGGADGFSFNLSDNPGTTFTPEEGAANGLSVCVDTYNNGASDAGLDIKFNGATLTHVSVPAAGGADGSGAPAELAIGQFVDTSVEVTATGEVTFRYATFVITAQIPNYSGITANQYLFAARTGGANENCWIDDIIFRNTTAAGPLITTGPTNQSVTAGQTATFSVVASGTEPLNYQWQRKLASEAAFSPIAGATTASYTTPATAYPANDNSSFKVVVSNADGTNESSVATLRVLPPGPVITTGPANQSVNVGQTATFNVVASGTAPLNYQWQRKLASEAAFSPIAGATTASYTTPATAYPADDNSSFKVAVGNAAGTNESSVATLRVLPPGTPLQLWTVGLDDDAWPAGDGGGANASFVQENGTINPLPGVPNSPEVNQQADNDYYFAGDYTTVIPANGAYTPVGVVAANEEAAERAFAAADNDLRYHFNLPSTLKPTDLLSVTFDALNLDDPSAVNTDPRYGIEVYINNVLVQTQIVIRPAQLGTDYTSPAVSLASVGAQVGPGSDNIVSLRGINYNAEGGGNWMGIDYVQLDARVIATPPPTTNTPPQFVCGPSQVVTQGVGAQVVANWATGILPYSIVRNAIVYGSDFSSLPAGASVAGSASVTNGVLHLTDAVNGQSGQFFTPAVDVPLESLSLDFKLRIGGGTCCGSPIPEGTSRMADGLSLNLGNDLGTGFGEEGTGTGLIVSFDLWDNGEPGAQDASFTAPNIDIRRGGTATATIGYQALDGDREGGRAPSGPLVTDPATGQPMKLITGDAFASVHIKLDADGTLDVDYKGVRVINNVPTGYQPITGARLGIGARTGGANANQWIDDLQLEAFSPDGSTAEAGQTVIFHVTTDHPEYFSVQPAVASNGTLSYTPAANLCGLAKVTIVAMDSGGTANGGDDTSEPCIIDINVVCVGPPNTPPTADNKSVTTPQDTPVNIALVGNDVDGDALSYLIVSGPLHGTLSGSGANRIYTPNAGYFGSDSFTFKVNDGQADSGVATVSISVIQANPNRNPIAKITASPLADFSPSLDDKVIIAGCGDETACVVLDARMSSDPDGDSLTFSWFLEPAPTPFAMGPVVTNCLGLGTQTIMLSASDGKGGLGTDTLTVEVINIDEALGLLIDKVNSASIARKNKRPFIATLKAATASSARGQCQTTANQLKAFQNKVRAQVSRDNPAEAECWTRWAQYVIDALNR